MKGVNPSISRDCSLTIKGIAVLLMVFHHCFGFPQWYVDVPSFMANAHLMKLALTFKICVPIFAFLTGWTYYHHKDKTIKYSIKKITTFILDYWIVVFPMSLFAFLFCGYNYSIKTLGELLPVHSHPLMIFTWYVWFYMLMMLAFPLFYLIEKHTRTIWLHLFFVGLAVGCLMILFFAKIDEFHTFCQWYPCAIVGYYIAKFRIFEFCLLFIKNKCTASLVSIVLLASSLYIYSFDSYLQNGSCLHACTRYTTAPLFILGFILFRRMVLNINVLWSSLGYVGKHSMNIWFVHCIFFSSVSRDVVQNIARFGDEPIWIFCVVILFSLVVSIAVSPIQNFLKQGLLLPLFR